MLARHLLLTLFSLLPGLAPALTFTLPPDGEDVIGEMRETVTRYEDTFSDLARANDLGYNELQSANPGIDPWLPGSGSKIRLPSRFILPPGPREGIVINLAELRLYYYPPNSGKVVTFPLGIGREGWSTPVGRSKIARKRKDPSWRPPKSIREEAAKEGNPLPLVVPPGPDNPLGNRALYLDLPGYLIHGTNKPYGVGMRVSHGCIRLYPEDITQLYDMVPPGTPVRIINQPYKSGWSNGRLYVEAHAPLVEQRKEQGNTLTPAVRALLKQLPRESAIRPDWKALQRIASQRLGYPVALPLQQPITAEPSAPLRSPEKKLVLSEELESRQRH